MNDKLKETKKEEVEITSEKEKQKALMEAKEAARKAANNVVPMPKRDYALGEEPFNKSPVKVKENDLSQEIKKEYQQLDNALHLTVNNDWRDKLEVELGDVKDDSNFHPQVKIKRWDNEVNFSVRLQNDENETFQSDKEKVKLVSSKKEVELHHVKPNEEYEKGAFKFEYILKEKPDSNVLRFSIETKGLNFFYQPPLNEDKLPPNGVSATATDVYDKNGKVIAHRPEHVVGSYAVYHKYKKHNYENGKYYKSGKAFHVYRPKIIDSEGKWCWADLKIDVIKKTYTVTIPKEFLDKAVYPIRSNDTFGYTDVGSTQQQLGNTYRAQVAQPTIPDGYTASATKMSGYILNDDSTYTKKVKYAIYGYNSDSDIGSLIKGSDEATVSTDETGAWYEEDLTSSQTITEQNYFIVAWGDEPAGQENDSRIKYDSAGCQGVSATESPYGDFPDTWGSEYNHDTCSSLYVTYSVSGTGTETVTAKGYIIPAGTSYVNIDQCIGALADYVRERDDGDWKTGATGDLSVGIDSNGYKYYLGLHFQNVPLPNNVKILRAYLKPHDNGGVANTTSDICRKRISIEPVADPQSFADLDGRRILERGRTDAKVEWNHTAQEWLTDYLGEYVESPELKEMFQELVDRTSQASGDNINVFLDENGSTEYYCLNRVTSTSIESQSTYLHITYYTLPGTTQKISAKARIEAQIPRTISAKAYIRRPWNPDTAYTYTTSYIYNMNNSNYKVGWRFRYNGPTGDIDTASIFSYTGGSGTSPTYRLGIQSVDEDGNPDGTWLGATNTGYGDSTLANASQWNEFTFNESVPLVNGQEYFLVLEYQSGTINTSNYRRILYGNQDTAGAFKTEKAHFENYDPLNKDYWQPNWMVMGSSTSPVDWNEINSLTAPIFYLITDDSQYWGPGQPTSTSLGTKGTVQVGFKWTAEEGMYLTSIGTILHKTGTPGDDLDYQILDVDDGNTVLASGTFVTEESAPGSDQWLYKELASEITLYKGVTYAITFRAPNAPDYSNCYGFETQYGMINQERTQYKNGNLYYSTDGGSSFSTHTNYMPYFRAEYRATFSTQTIQASAYIQKSGYIRRRVGYSYDDAFDYENGANNPTANNTRQGHRDPDGTYGDCTAGYRFRNIDIPKDGVIMSAYFKGTCYFTEAYTVDLTIQGVDADNEGDFELEAPSAKTPLTSASISWTSPTCTEDEVQTSPDLRSILQEIISRDGWSAGNAIALIFQNDGEIEDNNRNYRTWDYGSLNNALEKAPALVIETGERSTQTVAAKASISSDIEGKTQTVTAKGRIQATATQTITSKGRIQKQLNQIITSKGRVQISSTKEISTKGRIEISSTQTITAKSSVLREQEKTLQSKGRIQISSSQTVSSLGRIQISTLQTITAKGRVQKQSAQTITVKGNIKASQEKTLVAKGRIQISSTQTITALARIGLSGTSQTVTVKAKIVCITKPVLVSPAQFTTQTIPIYLVWEIPTCCKERNIHAQVQVDDTSSDFESLEKDLFSFRDSGFEYWDGDSWETYPTAGLGPAYYGNQARIQVSLVPGDKWWRVRGGVK